MIGNIEKVLLLDGVDEVCQEILEKNGVKVTVSAKLGKDELIAALKKHDAVVVRSATKITSDVLASCSKLKLVGRAGTGVDNIDVGAATKKGVIVMNTPGGNTLSAAEHTCAMICSLSRSIPQACSALKAGNWDRKKYMGNELNGKTLSIVGLGRIGKEVAKRMQSFGMTTIGYDPFVTKEAAAEWNIELMTLEELWPKSDYITVHTPLLPHTKNLIGDQVLSSCKKGVRIVNVARGGIVDEAALLKAMDDGRCGGAALDVFIEEPPTDLTVCQHPKVICTPHLGANTFEAQKRVAQEIAEQIADLNAGRPLVGVINAPSLTNALSNVSKPWIILADALGCLASNLIEDKFSSFDIKMELFGASSNMAKFLPSSFLVGLMKTSFSGVNLVNSSVFSEEKGVALNCVKLDSGVLKPVALNNGIKVLICDKTGATKHTLLGSSVGGQPTLFALDGCAWESGLTLGRNMLFFRAAKTVSPLAAIATKLSASSLTSLLSSSSNGECTDVFHVARTVNHVSAAPSIPDTHLMAQVSF